MEVFAVILSAVILFLSSFITQTYINIIVNILVGIFLISSGFLYHKSFIRIALRVLLGALLITFTFIKGAVSFGVLHTIISIIIGTLTLTSLFIKGEKSEPRL